MRRRLRSWLLCGALVLGAAGVPAAVAGPASATVIDDWVFDQRPVGFPAAAEPARTIASASGAVSSGPGGQVDVRVDLGGVPDEATAAILHLAFGTPDEDGSCLTAWETSVPTWEPGDPGEPGTAIQLAGSFEPDGPPWTCGAVWLSSTDGSQAYDRLQGRRTATVVADPGGWVLIGKVTGTRVKPHRWQTLHVRVRCSGSPIDGVVVRGYGRGVRVRKARIEMPLAGGAWARIPVRVRLDATHRRQVVLEVRPYGYLAFAGSGTKRVWLRPVRR